MASYPSFNVGEDWTSADANAIGLWRITTCTVSSAGGTSATASNGVVTIGSGNTSVTVSSAFDSTYDHYRLQFSNVVTAGNERMRLQLGTSTSHRWSLLYSPFNATFSNLNGTNSSVFDYLDGTRANHSFHVDVHGPNRTANTVISPVTYIDPGAAGLLVGIDESTTAHTSFTITPSGGSFSGGTIRVYGYRN